MRSLRFVYLLVLMLAVHAWCKPAGTAEVDEYSDDDPRSDYNDDETLSDDDEEGSPNDDDDAGSPDEPPQMISEPQSVHVRVGSTIKLPCLVKNIDNTLTTWQRDMEFLYSDKAPMTPDSKRIVLLANNTLVIHNAMVNDSSDNYQCSILTEPPITITHRVRVKADSPTVPPPAQPHKSVIRVTPAKRVEASAGESITLGCETKIQPTPNIKWFHEDKPVDSNLMIDSSHITIPNIGRPDAGHYQCLIEDGGNNPPIAGINVIVNYAPEIEAKKDLVHTGLGVKSELTCFVHAHPHANVVWYKNQHELHNERAGRIRMKTNKTMHHLEIHHTEVEDLGEYRCVAVNTMGQAEKIITLTGAPSQAIIYGGEVTNSDTGLILKWRLESYSPITEYQLKYRRKGEEDWNVVKPEVKNGSGNQFIVEHPIEGLQPGSYEAILMARNNFGWSQPSDPHTFTGEYAAEEKKSTTGSAATTQPLNILVALFLVLFARAFTSL